MHSTNYRSTFIAVAPDCRAVTAEVPPRRDEAIPSAAWLQYDLVSRQPYALTSDDVLFQVHAIRCGIPDADRAAAREAYFGKPQACLRSSPLVRRYGWGIHHDAEGRVALVPLGSAEYARLAADPGLAQTRGMATKRR